ncbi:hypothetical protein CAEBREN_22696 [Caenorhabditis brenneri]|uniref:Uncharacterized protein n=1 Tax=Caenorhabditis brenneri TaxID=135651 RepID=G0NZK2_CAEBE|nr:hypothetical protein CAEBREN_22696 [Caenorhabditis brenneri]
MAAKVDLEELYPTKPRLPPLPHRQIAQLREEIRDAFEDVSKDRVIQIMFRLMRRNFNHSTQSAAENEEDKDNVYDE